MKKVYYSWRQIEGAVVDIARQLQKDQWYPDYIVGITRGGAIPAVMLSHYLNVPMWTLNVRLRDGDGGESNLWMAEDALGTEPSIEITDENDIGAVLDAASTLLEMPAMPTFKNILIVDDINDTGATFNWIMNDWKSSFFPDNPSWDEVWNFNVKFAVLVDNLSSQCNVEMDYVGIEVNKAEEDVWVDFPWEDWWTK